MKKIRKGQKMLIILLIAVVSIIAIIGIVNIVRKSLTPKEPAHEDVVKSLPETTYSDMEVRNIKMEYIRDNDETMITMGIYNTTSNKIENESFDVVWVGQNEKILGKVPTTITDLEVGEQHNLSVILPGDLTETAEVKLIKK